MQDGFMTETAQAGMPVDYLNLLSNNDVPQDRKGGKDGWESRLSVDDKERNMVDFQTIRQVANASAPFVCVRDDYDLVASIYEFCRKLVDMAFNAAWLRKEKIAGHCNIVRHLDGNTQLVKSATYT